MTRIQLIIDPDAYEDDNANRNGAENDLLANLRMAVEHGEGITIRTAGGSFLVEAERVQGGRDLSWLRDADVVDRIALGLATKSEWDSGELEWIATLLGKVRPGVGDADPIRYVEDFIEATGQNPDTAPGLNQYLSDEYHDAVEEKKRERTCNGCETVQGSAGDLREVDGDKLCSDCADEAEGRVWTFVGHWESNEIVVEYVVEGRYQDPRVDTGYWEEGLFAAAGTGDTQEEALAAVRAEYEDGDEDETPAIPQAVIDDHQAVGVTDHGSTTICACGEELPSEEDHAAHVRVVADHYRA